MQNLETVRYMMATKAVHKLGDISRETPSLCVVYGEEGDQWVGRFLIGHGFFDVRFPKETTRELTKDEKKEWNGSAFGPGGLTMDVVIFPGFGVPKHAIVVKTKNSTYRFGKAEKDGMRTITRDNHPLDFSRAKITFLKVGRSILADTFDGREWGTSPVISIVAKKTVRPRSRRASS